MIAYESEVTKQSIAFYDKLKDFYSNAKAEGFILETFDETLKDNMIQGKAYVLTGMRKLAYVQKEDGTIVKEPKFLLNKIRMPWDYISLEYKA